MAWISWMQLNWLNLFLCVIFLLSCPVTMVEADTPEYMEHMVHVIKLSKVQQSTFLMGSWRIPSVSMNAGMDDWHYGLPDSIAHTPSIGYPDVVIAWYAGRLGVCYLIMSTGPSESDWKVVKQTDQVEVINPADLNGRRTLRPANDPRLFIHNHHLYIDYFVAPLDSKRDFSLYADRLYYDKAIDALYIQPPAKLLSIEKELGHLAQKNWMPFEYHHAKGNRRILLYVYSINPHRVVHMQSLQGNVLNMSTLSITQHVPSASLPALWKYSPIRGGSPAKLVHTVHGNRYLTLFHSPYVDPVTYIQSYHMGAYLFNSHPPFAITHITPDLIACKQCYDEYLGWTYKAVDYINFPMGFVIRENNTVFLAIGKNDNCAFLLKMNKTALIEYMVPVDSTVKFVDPAWNIEG